MTIMWENLAQPQPDGSDIVSIKQILKTSTGYEKKTVGTEFLSSVALLSYDGTYNPGRIEASPETIARVERGMAIWPELSQNYQELIEFVIFCQEPEYAWNSANGCTCGHIYFNHKNKLNAQIGVFVGMIGTLGSLEALAHECGHLRLHMLGIHIEDHDGQLILNGPDELFDSPIRKDKPRPMSAVLQAQYSYVMVSDMDLKYYDAALDDAEKQRTAISYLRMNIPRIAKGHDEVQSNVRTTANGARFMDGFWRYSDAVIERGLKLIG
jgi:hypothetical protein